MPRRVDIKKVLIIGSGPIVIGQACEFDYSGTQACKALMNEGLEVILVNSNPATIMTDPEVATRVYIEPLKMAYLEKIISIERPDAVIPTLGGQTALNLALELYSEGVLKKYNTQLLGASPDVIKAAEDRELFRDILDEVGAKYPQSCMVRTFEQGMEVANKFGYPLILRPNYTLGGGGGGIAYSAEEYKKMIAMALHESPTSEVLVEESILGWKEFELEIMRDSAGTFVVVCSIENLDPCGVHTGDSITVAPQQTLSDREYQEMRDEACKIINRVGVQTGGANVQFAVNPLTGERVVIEMNPRVSRSSALASKATGFPIAKIAALLAIGYNLDEIKNDITQLTPSCYEPSLDYVVTKIPRFAFEKFYGAKDLLSTQMKSVGEVMGIGRTLQESLMKALISLEFSSEGIPNIDLEEDRIAYPNSQRIFHLFQAFRNGKTVEDLVNLTQIDSYFLEQIEEIIKVEHEIKDFFYLSNGALNRDIFLKAKRKGLSDSRIGKILGKKEEEIRQFRENEKLFPSLQSVDTCAGEFPSSTPYLYSSYWSQNSTSVKILNPVVVIGSGPNRIGQGIEFDYSCVRGVKAFRKSGIPVAMVNSNPETVSTDYDTSDILFFEPLSSEHLIEIMRFVQSRGFVAQLGGQTPINIAPKLVKAGYKLMGSSLEAIDFAEDRAKFADVCRELEIAIPNSALAGNIEEALAAQKKLGFPIICRPSYVLGGRRMEVIENHEELISYFERYSEFISISRPCLMDQFLAGALEVDVDLVRGRDWTVVGGIIEHIEAAGVHSGDSMGVIPPQRLKKSICDKIEKLSVDLADRIGVIGHLNLQLAVQKDVVYILEANPRSSRSVPFIVKAAGIPLVDLGILAMLGKTRKEIQIDNLSWRKEGLVSVKGVVFPFKKFPEADAILGPEMKSTGESMGRARTYSEALIKAFLSSHVRMPLKGEVFFSLRDKDKSLMLELARKLSLLGYSISGTTGTAKYFNDNGVKAISHRKVHEGRPHCVDKIRTGEVSIVINTTTGRRSIEASFDIRRACIDYNIPCLTESDAAAAFVMALDRAKKGEIEVFPL